MEGGPRREIDVKKAKELGEGKEEICRKGTALINSNANGAGGRMALHEPEEHSGHNSRLETGICLQWSASACVATCTSPEPKIKSRSIGGAIRNRPAPYAQSSRKGTSRRWVIVINVNVTNGGELVKSNAISKTELYVPLTCYSPRSRTYSHSRSVTNCPRR